MAAALLASIHDVSPLTLEACRQGVALLHDAAGIEPEDLTLLVIPFHEGRVRVTEDPATVAWLRGMADAGATLVLHGLTHRMPRPVRNPARFAAGYGFARGQGELYCLPADETASRLGEGRDLVERAGLAEAASCFIPPAWLLSKAGRRAVEAAQFTWIELFDGLHTARGSRPLRLIGWGSLNSIEAAATVAFAFLQRQRAHADTRLCVHPADLRRDAVRRSIAATARHLRRELAPKSYARYLREAPIDVVA